MQTINIALFIYSSLLLVAIYMYSRQTKYSLMSDKYFKALIQITFVLLVFDLLARIEGMAHPTYPFFKHVGNFVTYGISHFIPSLWLLYIHYKIYADIERTKKLYKYLIIISAVNLVLLIITQFTGWYYYIDATNFYYRGPLFMWTQVVNTLLMLASVILLIRKRHRINHSEMASNLIFTLIPTTGLIAHIILPGIAFIPNSITIALVILFIFVQNNRMRNDHLTGIFNRLQIDIYLEYKINQAKKGQPFTAILIDVDNFKVINDTFGHVLGDEAIKKTVSLLYDVCQKNEFLARYGGDEFLIITTKHEPYDIEQLLNKIGQVFESFNKRNNKYQLNISYGYYTYESSMSLTDAEFLDIVDQNMFKNKKEKRQLGVVERS